MKIHNLILYTTVVACCLSTSANSKTNISTQVSLSCTSQYVDNAAPSLSSARHNELVTPLCLEGIGIGYSHRLRTPVWSATYLTRDRLRGAYDLQRTEQFHEELQLPKRSRVSLDEMRVYHYDRGHLAPNYDMGTRAQQLASFSLANIVLQDRWHNRNLWSDVEKLTRHQVYTYGDAYVVTGAAFLKGKQIAPTGLIIPSHIFKAIYIPEFNQAGVYWSRNDNSQHLDVISLKALKDKTGLNAMPSLPDFIQNTPLYLPTDMSDPEADVNLVQAIEAHKPLFNQITDFFKQLWDAIVNILG